MNPRLGEIYDPLPCSRAVHRKALAGCSDKLAVGREIQARDQSFPDPIHQAKGTFLPRLLQPSTLG